MQERTVPDERSAGAEASEDPGQRGTPPSGPPPREPSYEPGRFGLGLRARATVAFGLIAMILSGFLALLAYELTRNYLIDQRQATAMRQAYVNARLARSVLRSPEANVTSLLSSLQSTSNSRAVLHYQGRWFASTVGFGPSQVPADLRQAALNGRAGRQRDSIDDSGLTSGGGKPYIVVGVPLPAADATYFEFTNVAELDRTLSLLARGLAFGAAITALSGAAVGRYASSRVVRPLKGMAAVAAGISHGGLDERLDAKGDRDLEPLVESFNDMVDTLQERIHREARFASDVSHELRTPLAAIQAAINIVRRRRNSPEALAEALDMLEQKVTSFNGLVTDLLEISRLEAGVARLEKEPVDLERFARSVLSAAGRSSVPLGIDATAPKRAMFDSRRVSQLLTNLLENADKYAGGPTGLVISGSDGVVRLAVEDRGPGIAEHERHHSFERFVRGESSNRPGAGDGTGLGLSLVAEHARLHEGRVWVEDRPGGGSRFVVELPVGDTQ